MAVNREAGNIISKRTYGTVRFLALADLRHEWLLNLCMVLALAAVLTPLLLLLGLKNGVVETMRERLVQDPIYRELKPQETLNLRPEWFQDMARRGDVAFALPTILRGSSIIRVGKRDDTQFVAMDLLPTGPGDALLKDNGGLIPAEGEVTLSADAASKLGASPGDFLNIKVTRSRSGKMESVNAEVKVISVLAAKADAQQRIYAPLSLVADAEIYREGQGVPSRNWAGGLASPFLSFDGVYIVAPEGLDSLVISNLGIGTGFTLVENLTVKEFAQKTGLTVKADTPIIDVKVLKEPVQWASWMALKEKLRGRNVVLLPYVSDILLKVAAGTGAPMTLRVFGLSPSENDRRLLSIPELPWGALKEDKPYSEYAQILLPAGIDMPKTENDTLVASLPNNETLSFPIKIAGQSFNTYAIAPWELLATLRTSSMRDLRYSAEHGALLLERNGFSGFRLYSRTIDQVAGLHQFLREQGIETITKVQDIERIRTLDLALTKLFWLVAVVGIVGGIAALIASLYAAVERKKRDVSMMRLMGLSRFDVSRFPVYQSTVISATAALISILVFYALAATINSQFGADLQFGDGICRLDPLTLVQAFIITLLTAVISSLFAAWRTTLIEPAEAIRAE